MQAIELPYTIKRRADKNGRITHKNHSLAGQEITITFTRPKKNTGTIIEATKE